MTKARKTRTRAPGECRTLEDVRSEIDRLDRQVIELLALRYEYVHAAAKFKPDATAIPAPDRQAIVFKTRRGWASEVGLSPDVIERVWRELMAYYITREREVWLEHSGA